MLRDWKPVENYLADVHIHNGKFHEAKVTVHENTAEEKAMVGRLAEVIDDICYSYDYYGYQDALVGSREDNVEEIRKNIWNCGKEADDIIKGLKDIIADLDEQAKAMNGDLTSVEQSIASNHLSDDDEKHLKEMHNLFARANLSIDQLSDYVSKHRCWNDDARRDFPKLSFLMGGFETGIYQNLEKGSPEWEFFQTVEKFLDIETKMSTHTFNDVVILDPKKEYRAVAEALGVGEHTDKMTELCADKSDLEAKYGDVGKRLSEAVKKWFEGNYVEDFYDARENTGAFRDDLTKLLNEYKKEYAHEGMKSMGISDVVKKDNKSKGVEKE